MKDIMKDIMEDTTLDIDGQLLKIIRTNSSILYYIKNKILHRLGGAATIHNSGTKYWFKEGKKHRVDGPAEEYCNRNKYWYYEGKQIKCNNQEEFQRIINL